MVLNFGSRALGGSARGQGWRGLSRAFCRRGSIPLVALRVRVCSLFWLVLMARWGRFGPLLVVWVGMFRCGLRDQAIF